MDNAVLIRPTCYRAAAVNHLIFFTSFPRSDATTSHLIWLPEDEKQVAGYPLFASLLKLSGE